MKKTLTLLCLLAMAWVMMGVSCTQDHHDINTYTGYGAGNGNNLPDNNNPNRGNTTTTNNLPPGGGA